MASYDLKAILGEKLKRLTDKTLKALVDCMCTVGASLCSLDKRVSALESVELPEGGYKPMQEPVASPSASGTAIQFIESASQDATGRMTATKKTVRDGTTSQKGVVQLAGSIGATVASENNKAATEKAVRDAINALDSRLAPNADMYVAEYGVISEFTAMTNARGEGKKICVAVGLGGGSSGFNSAEAIVPLSYVEFGSESAIVAFYFNMPRDSYGDVNARGSILQVKCTSTGWDVTTLSPYYADTAGVAATAGSANTATSATTAGSATNATNATNDGAGAEIKTTYVMDARTGSTVVGDATQFIASVDVMTDDASVGNRKYLQFTKKFLPVACKMTLLATPIQDKTTGDHVVLEYGTITNYYSVACRYSTSYNSITGPNVTLASMKRFIEVDFDYRLLRIHSNEHICVQFALCAVSRETGNNSRITKISMADDTVFAKATVQFYAPSGVVWYRGHVHLVGDKSTISSFGNKGLALVATSLIGEQTLTGNETVDSIIDNITIKETSEY